MKKVVAFLFGLVACLLGLMLFALSSVAFASDFIRPDYLNGNRNFIICDEHMGLAYYVDRSSLVVQKYAPPVYRIAINVVSTTRADGQERGDDDKTASRKINGVDTYQFFYNWDSRMMYVDNGDGWRYLDPNGTWAETGVSMPAGEIAFYLAYHMNFYPNEADLDRLI